MKGVRIELRGTTQVVARLKERRGVTSGYVVKNSANAPTYGVWVVVLSKWKGVFGRQKRGYTRQSLAVASRECEDGYILEGSNFGPRALSIRRVFWKDFGRPCF